MTQENQTHINSIVSWTALGVAVIAFVIAVSAFNKFGEPLDEVVQEQTAETAEDVRLATVRAESEARLLALRTRMEAEDSTEEIADEVAEIRADLSAAYDDTQAEAGDQFQKLNANLEKLEQDVRNGSADAIGTLEESLALLRQEVRYDE